MFAQKPWSLSESILLQTRQQQFPQLLWLTEEVAMKNLSISAWCFKFGITQKMGEFHGRLKFIDLPPPNEYSN
jgi:hypothetical protein